MKNRKSDTIRLEIREISDADNPPEKCPNCSSLKYTRLSYYFRDIQDLGTPDVKKVVRYESVVWICKDCGSHIVIKNPLVLDQISYMPGILEYVRRRVLEKGDAARRVLSDLQELHNVDVSISTINKWIDQKKAQDHSPTEFNQDDFAENFSGALNFDGTFRAVKSKKNEMQDAENEPLWLHLTHLPDGRLVAYWQEGKPKKK